MIEAWGIRKKKSKKLVVFPPGLHDRPLIYRDKRDTEFCLIEGEEVVELVIQAAKPVVREWKEKKCQSSKKRKSK